MQNAGLGPDDYRGDRLLDHPQDVTGDPDLLNLTRPDLILDAHRRYLAAGADITTTNTYIATRIGQSDYGLQRLIHEMNLRGAELARQAVSEAGETGGRFVAGSIGLLNVALSLSPRVEDPAYRAVSYDEVYDAYAEQASALAEGGVDLLLIETIFDTCAERESGDRGGPRRGAAPAAVDLGDDRGQERADAVGADGGGVLGRRWRTPIR